MPSWKIHEKWCKALGVRREVCQKINKIVDLPPHDIEDKMLKEKWLREAFESGMPKDNPLLTLAKTGSISESYEKLIAELNEITFKFGGEGIRATFCHIALDRIAELIELGFNREKIKERLIENELMSYVPDYDQVFTEISREARPSPTKMQRRKEFEELAKSGVHGVFVVDGVLLPPTPALVKIKSKLKKSEIVYIEWGSNVYEARKGRIRRTLYKLEDLAELIKEVNKLQTNK